VSLFDEFSSSAFSQAGSIIGVESFTLTGIDDEFTGILNEYESNKQLDVGGIMAEYTATITCELDQFDDLDGPLERWIDGRVVNIAGRRFKVVTTRLDTVSLTIMLANESNPR
jgi:hypothetical protein